MHLDIRVEQGPKEWEPLYVVHVEMTEQDVDPTIPGTLDAERPYPASGVENDARAFVCGHLERRGVAAVPDRLGTCRGD